MAGISGFERHAGTLIGLAKEKAAESSSKSLMGLSLTSKNRLVLLNMYQSKYLERETFFIVLALFVVLL